MYHDDPPAGIGNIGRSGGAILSHHANFPNRPLEMPHIGLSNTVESMGLHQVGDPPEMRNHVGWCPAMWRLSPTRLTPGPKWAKSVQALPVASDTIVGGIPKRSLLHLGRKPLNAVAGLTKPWEPSGSHGHVSDAAQVHDEGAGLAEAGGGLPIETEHSAGQPASSGHG